MTTPQGTTPHGPIDCEAVRDLTPLFVTGALEAMNADAVRDHLARCGAPHGEVLELGEAAIALLDTVDPVDPPAGLKARLLAAAEADLLEGRHPSVRVADPGPGAVRGAAPVTSTAPSPATAPRPAPAPVVAIHHSRVGRPALAWLAAAAVIVAVALAGWNLSLRQQVADVQAYQAGVDATLSLAAQPGSVSTVLVTEGGGPAGVAVVGADGTVQLALRGLAPTSGTRVYTAWAIAGDAAPVPLSDIRVGADGVAVATGWSPVTQGGMVLALTLEPTGGATIPTMPIIASGVAGPPAG